jgi:ribosomal protein L28
MCIYKCMLNVYKNQQNRQTGSRNLMGPKTLPTIWGTYTKLVTKYQIPVINSCWEKCDEKCAYTNVCSMCIKINKVGKQEVGIRWVQKRFPRYGVPIWSLWPNIRFLPSIVAEKNATKNEHICSMCIKINKVGKQEVGIRWVQKPFPRYGVPIWSLWPNIRFLPSTVAEKNVTKNVHICSMCIKTN